MNYVSELKKTIVGRRIVKAEAHAFLDGRGRNSYAHQWKLTLDDGTRLAFITQETEGADYGVLIVAHTADGRQIS